MEIWLFRIGRWMMTFLAVLIMLPLSVCAGAYFLVRRKQKPARARVYPFPGAGWSYVTREDMEAAFESIAKATEKEVKKMFEEEK